MTHEPLCERYEVVQTDFRTIRQLNSLSHRQWAVKRKSGDFVFAQKGDAGMLLRIDDEVLKSFGPRWPAGNPIMSADRHHATLALCLRVEQFEVVS